MAILQPGFYFTGTLDNLSAYKMKGSDKIILRRKGGADKNTIYTSGRFERTRENYSEFSGRSVACRVLRKALYPVNLLTDHNMVNTLQPIFRAVQVLDSLSVRGQRHVCLTKAPHLLNGYSLNKRSRFDSIARGPLSCRISKETLSAEVVVPGLVPGVNFFPHTALPFFRVVVTLGVIPDVYYHPDGYYPDPVYDNEHPVRFEGEWHHTRKGCAGTTVQLQLPSVPAADHCLVVAVGIAFATVDQDGVVVQRKYPGVGKVVGVE